MNNKKPGKYTKTLKKCNVNHNNLIELLNTAEVYRARINLINSVMNRK